MKKNFKKAFVLIISCILVLSNMITAFGRSDINEKPKYADWHEGRTLVSGDGVGYGFKSAETITVRAVNADFNGFQTAKWTEQVGNHKIYLLDEGTWAYCIDHGSWINSPAYTKQPSGVNQKYKELLGEKNFNNFGYALYYGYKNQYGVNAQNALEKNGFFDSNAFKRSGRSKSAYNRDDWYWATQMIIWEITQGHRSQTMDLITNPYGVRATYYASTLRGRPAEDIYNWIVSAIKNEGLYPKYIDNGVNTVIEKAKTLTLNEKLKVVKNDVTYYRAIFFDTTGRHPKYDVKSSSLEGAEILDKDKAYIEYDNNTGKYTLHVCEDFVKAKRKLYILPHDIDNVATKEEKLAIYSYHTPETNSDVKVNQNMVLGYPTPKGRWIKIKPFDVPPPPCGDRPEPEYFPTFNFKVEKEDLNEGWTGDKHTPMGDATLNATYVLYRNGVEVDRVTLDEYGTEATLQDQPWSNADVFTYAETGERPHIVKKKVHCVVKPTKLSWDANVEYEIKELRPDGRFIEPDKGYRKFSAKYHAETNDSRDCMDKCPMWSDIQYNVEWKVTDGDMTANEGKGVGTISEVDDVLTYGVQTYINDCYRGKLTLSKSLQDENIFHENDASGGYTDSRESLWTLKLNSSGYEKHPYVRYVKEPDLADGTAVYRVTRDTSGVSCEDVPMKIGSNGDLLVLDIPFGKYTMSEVKADNPSYVLEHFQVDIVEHTKTYDVTGKNDDRYDYNVRNKVKKNVIKIIKTNAETGKQVYEAGTKFYLKYKGNPLNPDPTTTKYYDRFLPNAESITKDGGYTFTLNNNGEIELPYEIPWGIYELYEFVLPEGYFVGEYPANEGSNHHYGDIAENQVKVLQGHSFTDVVSIVDAQGNPYEYKGKDKYQVNEIFNIYRFKVEKQADHYDGNFGTKVDSVGVVTEADKIYDKAEHPYDKYDKEIAMPNQNVKGKIRIKKLGEVIVGFVEKIIDLITGQEVTSESSTTVKVKEPIKEYKPLKNAKFEIYATDDNKLNDGNMGGRIFDSKGNEIIIPTDKSTHRNNRVEEILGLLDMKYTASIYDTGKTSLDTGEEMFFLKERLDSEKDFYKRVITTGKSKGTTYSYTYEKVEDDKKILYEIFVKTKLNAGRENVTDIKVVKTTTLSDAQATSDNLANNSYATDENGVRVKNIKPNTVVNQKYGETVMDFSSYFSDQGSDFTQELMGDKIVAKSKIELYEADGKTETSFNGSTTDYSKLAKKRLSKRNYTLHTLNSEDVTPIKEKVVDREEVVVNGITYPEVSHEEIVTDKIIDEPAVINADGFTVDKPAKKYDENGNKLLSFEKTHNTTLVNEKIGELATVVKTTAEGDTFETYYLGYTEGDKYTRERGFIKTDKNGNVLDSVDMVKRNEAIENAKKDGFNLTDFSSFTTENIPYVVMEKEVQDKDGNPKTIYQVLLDDFTFTTSDKYGNFENMLKETYEVSFTNAINSEKSYSFSLDGFSLSTTRNGDKVETNITKQDGSITPEIHTGTGYSESSKDLMTTFKTEDNKANFYILTKDNVKVEMIYQGDRANTKVTIPLKAVSKNYALNYPKVTAYHTNGSDGSLESCIIDWYKPLTPEHNTETYKLFNGNQIISTKLIEVAKGEEYITLDIVSIANDKEYIEIEFLDGYKMKVYGKTLPTGEQIGVIEYDSIYNTVRSSKTQYIETIETDDNGVATSSLLPLGRYYVKEVFTPEGWVNKGETQEAEITYKDQFTPLIWKDLSFKNNLVEYEIDGLKGFEKTFGKKDYRLEGGAVFGIFSDEEITTLNGKIDKDTLVKIFSPDEKGLILKRIKLPAGKYYIKEIKTKNGYILDTKKLPIKINSKYEANPPKFEDFDNGIKGEVSLDSLGNGELNMVIQARHPMPTIKINGRNIELDKNLKEDNLEIMFNGAEAQVKVKLNARMPKVSIELFNSKKMEFELKKDYLTYDFGDGVGGLYSDGIGYTGIYEGYKHEFVAPKGEGLEIKTESFEIKINGKSYNVTIKHTPILKPKNKPEDKDAGQLSTDGYQMYNHEANVTGDVTISLASNPNEDKSISQGNETFRLTKLGNFEFSYTDIIEGEVPEALRIKIEPKDAATIIKSENIVLVQNFTLKRTNSSSSTTKIKFNAWGDKTPKIFGNDLENITYVPVPETPQTPQNPKEEIKTKALDKATKEHYGQFTKKTTLVDTVSYKNLVVGQEYTVVGVLMDKATGKPFLDAKGKEVRGKTVFTPTQPNGEVDVVFTFDGRGLKPTKTVVFEDLYENNKLIAYHHDINDENQTVDYNEPAIKTQAKDGKSGTKVGKVEKIMQLVDTVSYHNLIVGKEYTVAGVLMDKATGKPFLDAKGKEVRGKTVFTPTQPNGEVDVVFTFDGRGLKTTFKTVVFEDLYENNKLIAYHHDINDEGQTVKWKKKIGRIVLITDFDKRNIDENNYKIPKTDANLDYTVDVAVLLLAVFFILLLFVKKQREQ